MVTVELNKHLSSKQTLDFNKRRVSIKRRLSNKPRSEVSRHIAGLSEYQRLYHP